MLPDLLHQVTQEYRTKSAQKSIPINEIHIATPHAWDFEIRMNFPDKGTLCIGHLTEKHLNKLKAFKHQLSERSRELVPCYPWEDELLLEKSLQQAIKKTKQKTDASYLIDMDGRPIGHFFLWKAGSNPHSLAHGVDIPELGVAIADEYQGQGLGTLAVKLLQAVALSLEKDAIELTTAQSNNAGWHTYLNAGFEYTGDIHNPLEVDVTEAFAGQVHAPRVRIERQMIYIINHTKRAQILAYLIHKRKESEKFVLSSS